MTGVQVFDAMLEQDREALCGPRWQRLPERRAVRGGSARSEVTLGGRRITIRRPWARGDRELALPSFTWAAGRDPLDERTVEAIALGVSSRGYRRSLEALPRHLEERSVSRSAVSRRFVALSTERLAASVARPLGALDLRIVMIDGLHFREHVVLIALGIDADGHKHVLGLREGTTGNATVVRALLADLVERGLDAERVRLYAIAGAKALRKAVREVFGDRAVVQRCQVHKERNVLDHLPERMRPSGRRAIRQAYASEDAALAQRQLERLARSSARIRARPPRCARGLRRRSRPSASASPARSTARCAVRTRSRT